MLYYCEMQPCEMQHILFHSISNILTQLFIIYYLLYNIYYILFIIYYLLFIIYYLLFIIYFF